MSGVMASLLCSTVISTSAFADSSTVSITAEKTSAKSGEAFEVGISFAEVEISFADVSPTGINSYEFAIKYDTSVLDVTDVVSNTGLTDENAIFEANISENEGMIYLIWATASESDLWLKEAREYITISGTVSETATAGDVSPIEIVAVPRLVNPDSSDIINSVYVGYFDGTNQLGYETVVTAGEVEVIDSETTTTTTTTTPTVTKWGDANCDGTVNVSDAVAVTAFVSNSTKNTLSAQGEINADVHENGNGLNATDAYAIQQYATSIIETLPVS